MELEALVGSHGLKEGRAAEGQMSGQAERWPGRSVAASPSGQNANFSRLGRGWRVIRSPNGGGSRGARVRRRGSCGWDSEVSVGSSRGGATAPGWFAFGEHRSAAGPRGRAPRSWRTDRRRVPFHPAADHVDDVTTPGVAGARYWPKRSRHARKSAGAVNWPPPPSAMSVS